MNSSFMESLTFQELQEMGRYSTTTTTTASKSDFERPVEASFGEGKPQKRVRFQIDEKIKSEKILKSDFFIHLSHKIRLSEREKLTSWLDFRGFELIWSLEASLKYSDRKILIITGEEDENEYDATFVVPYKLIERKLQIEGAYFRILDQG